MAKHRTSISLSLLSLTHALALSQNLLLVAVLDMPSIWLLSVDYQVLQPTPFKPIKGQYQLAVRPYPAS